MGESEPLFADPLHPYTNALMDAVPIPDPAREAQHEHIVLKGEVPSALNPPSGCVFHPRCPMAVSACAVAVPQLEEFKPPHWAACSELDRTALAGTPMADNAETRI